MRLFIFLFMGLLASLEAAPRLNPNECTVSINKKDEFPDPQPLILNPNFNEKESFIYPNSEGILKFQKGDEILLACTGPKNKFNVPGFGKETEHNITCNGNNNFLTKNQKSLKFKQIVCQKNPYHSARITKRKCYGNNLEVEIGFKVKNKFLVQITLCHDDVAMDTLWTHFKLVPQIHGYQKNFPRPGFEESIFYNRTTEKIDNLYKRGYQQKTFEYLLGEVGGEYIKSTGEFYLARGHLVAKADFVYGVQQRATFYFVNAAPQWQVFNGGNWNDLEYSVRKYGGNKQLGLDVYTGIYDVSTLPDSNNEQQELYLLANGNVKGLMVPKYFWKVVYDPISKKGIAFVGSNNPYQFDPETEVFCKDVCNQINWVKWNSKNITQGYGFCCDVDSFREVIDFLPEFRVTGILK